MVMERFDTSVILTEHDALGIVIDYIREGTHYLSVAEAIDEFKALTGEEVSASVRERIREVYAE